MNDAARKRIAVLSPIHRRPDLVAEQLRNYRAFGGDSLLFVLHPSHEGRAIVRELIERLGPASESVLVCPRSANTSWACIFGAFLEASATLEREARKDLGWVYLHTDGDLLFKGDLAAYVEKSNLAYRRGPIGERWQWSARAFADPRFTALRRFAGIPVERLMVGRQEGTFVPADLWFEAVAMIRHYYRDDFFDARGSHWPIEEAVLPTVLGLLAPRAEVRRPVVKTKEIVHREGSANPRDSQTNALTVAEIEAMLADDTLECAGAKWFAQELDDPARVFVRSLEARAAAARNEQR